MNFNLKNVRRNEFQDNNEKSCSLSRKRISKKILFKDLLQRNDHADSVRVKQNSSLIISTLKETFSFKIEFFPIRSSLTLNDNFKVQVENFLRFLGFEGVGVLF